MGSTPDGKNLLPCEEIPSLSIRLQCIWETTMIMTVLLPLKAYLSTLMKAVACSVQAYSFYCIYHSSSVIRQNFPILNYPIYLDPSYKINLDLWDV